MKFEYDEIHVGHSRIEEVFSFQGKDYYSLRRILDVIGLDGWELIGEVRGKIIVKRSYEETV